ncbi:MAG: MFS transporter [Clostridia bacterium]
MKSENKFIFLCCFLYFSSYIARSNYGVVILEIVDNLHITNSEASIAVTLSFISYGVGQLISGVLGDRFHPKWLLLTGIIATSVINFLVVFTQSVVILTLLWTLNGFSQSLIWPPLIKIMAINLSESMYKKSCAYVTMSCAFATCFIYILAPVCVAFGGYKTVFLLTAILGAICSVLWYKKAPLGQFNAMKNAENNISSVQLIIKTGIAPLLLVIVIHGALRDGVATWMPTFISENFAFSNVISILSTVILPIFSIIIIAIMKNISAKNEMNLASVIMLISCVSSIILLVLRQNVVISITSMALISSCMQGMNLILLSNLPVKFLKYGKVATLSGILNSFTYIGSALATYGIAKVTEIFGWNTTILLWIVITLISTIICFNRRKIYTKLV